MTVLFKGQVSAANVRSRYNWDKKRCTAGGFIRDGGVTTAAAAAAAAAAAGSAADWC